MRSKEAAPEEPTQLQIERYFRGEMSPIRSFYDWVEAWAVHGAVVADKTPHKVADQFAYFLLLAAAHRDIPGLGWLDYDTAFRKYASGKPFIVWGEVMPTLWMTTVLARTVLEREESPF